MCEESPQKQGKAKLEKTTQTEAVSTTRRTHLKQLGVGLTSLGVGSTIFSGNAKADHSVGYIDGGNHYATEWGDYPYQWTDSHYEDYTFAEDLRKAWTIAVEAQVVDPDKRGDEDLIGVEVSCSSSTRWLNPENFNKECKEIESQKTTITYDESDEEDFHLRGAEEWVGSYEGPESYGNMDFAADFVAETIDLGVSLTDSTIGTAYNVAMDLADFGEGVYDDYEKLNGNNQIEREFRWNYVSNSSRVFSGQKDATSTTYFEMYLNPGQELTFDVEVETMGRRYASTGHRATFTIGHPDWDDDGGIQ